MRQSRRAGAKSHGLRCTKDARSSARADWPRIRGRSGFCRRLPCLEAWKSSRDLTLKAGRPGNGQRYCPANLARSLIATSTKSFASLRENKYWFSKLRVVFVPKQNSDKERVIVLQYEIVSSNAQWWTFNLQVGISDQQKMFFIWFYQRTWLRNAIKRALELRSKYDWCLKT